MDPVQHQLWTYSFSPLPVIGGWVNNGAHLVVEGEGGVGKACVGHSGIDGGATGGGSGGELHLQVAARNRVPLLHSVVSDWSVQ